MSATSPVWIPGPEERNHSNIAVLMREQGLPDYASLHAWSVKERAAFWQWGIARLGLQFEKPPTAILDTSDGIERAHWLPGARYNIAESCFSGDLNRPAIVSSGPGAALSTMTLGELDAESKSVAQALVALGLEPGTAVAIDMPMNPRSIAIYLGIVRAGMAVVSIADSMAPDEVNTRLRIAGARLLFTVGHMLRGGKRLPLYEKLLLAFPPTTIVDDVDGAMLRPQDIVWRDFLRKGNATAFAPVMGDSDHTTNILFSSGTTGEPKAIPWTQLAPIKSAVDGHLHLDIRPGDVVAWPTNLGWMMGPWLIYASLLNRATVALYCDAPTSADFGRFVQDARVTMLGVVPSIVKTWRSDDRMKAFDWRHLRCFGSTGEASNAEDYAYLMDLAGGRPVIEYCGGTEIGGGYITGTLVQPQKPATFTTPALGSDFVLLDEQGQVGDNGEVFLIPPTLGYSERLLNRDHHSTYFEGTPAGPHGEILRRHGDQIARLPDGGFQALGRVDDTMNLGGIKVSSAEIERVLDAEPGIGRTAAVAINPKGGGPSLLVVYVAGAAPTFDPAKLASVLQNAIKNRLNPLFRIHEVIQVEALPVTASNKIMRRELRSSYRPSSTD
jgi:acetyl-CoA synthetase